MLRPTEQKEGRKGIKIIDFLLIIIALLCIASGFIALLSIFFVCITFKWARIESNRSGHAFWFYLIFALFLLDTMAVILDPSLGAFIFWCIWLAGLSYYFYKLRNPATMLNKKTSLNSSSGAFEPPKTKIKAVKESSKQQRVEPVKVLPLKSSEKNNPNSYSHSEEDQLLRQRNAKKCTIISIDKEQQTAQFKGSGKKNYTTTPDSCTCVDFGMRKLPCKHMYRLMHELGEFNLDMTPEGRVSETRSDVDFNPSILNGLSEDALRELSGLVREWIAGSSRNDWLYYRDNMPASELVGCGLLEEFDHPEKTLSVLHIKILREEAKGLHISLRYKKDIILSIIKERPNFVDLQKRKYWVLRFREEHYPIRGRLRAHLKAMLPETYVEQDEYIGESLISALR